MNVAVVHHLPTGGAFRVLSEWAARTAGEVTVYTRDASVHAFAPLPDAVRVVEQPLHAGDGAADELRRLAGSPRDGRALAATIDAAGHDVVWALPSRLTQAIDVLPFLRTPTVFYAPEPMRSAYEPRELIPLPPGWRGTITRWGVNPLERRRRALDRRYIAAAPHVITHSQFTRQTLRDVYGIESRVVPLGVDAQSFTPGTWPRERFVLSVGALHPLKGHELAVDAVARVGARLVIVGDRGEMEPALRARAQAAGVELDLRQGLPFAELTELYRRAGAVVCPQIREPFGLVPLEAMASATPVVAVDEGGLRETVRDGETGYLVPRDAAAVADALERVLADGEALGAAGREAVLADWTWERSAAAIDAELEVACTSG